MVVRFFEARSPRGNFVVHFRTNPMSDFGIWACGYAQAARGLAKSLLSGPHFADYEAYPVVFLYRHATELYLKACVIQGARLSALRDRDAICERLRHDHRLPPLLEMATRVLERAFPEDESLPQLVVKLRRIVEALNAIDPDAFAFRYPVNKAEERAIRPSSRDDSASRSLPESGPGSSSALRAWNPLRVNLPYARGLCGANIVAPQQEMPQQEVPPLFGEPGSARELGVGAAVSSGLGLAVLRDGVRRRQVTGTDSGLTCARL
jgi:hypothetical protein